MLRFSVCLTLVLAFAACSDSDTADLTRPGVRALYTTPTGLVTANPPQVFVGAGDITSCGNNNDEATAKLLDSIPGTVYNLGDDAYDNGTTAEFSNCYDPTWGRAKARTYPSPGNHEYNTSGAAPYFAYFGAVAGTPGQGWYSFNLGAWHIISLNSNISLNTGGTQDTWLKADLAAHPNQCILAYYHHPLYSSTGGTGTGGLTYSSSRMFVNDLYAAHADLILNGHRHFYERLAPMNPSGGYDSTNGVRELIAGTGGIGGGSETDLFPLHEAGNGSTFGVLKLWLYDDSYAWKFVPVAGQTYTDSGTTPCHSAGGGGGSTGVSAANSTVSAAPTSFTAGSGSSTITVTAKDGSGNVISGASVTVAASGSGNTLTPASGTTNSSGVFTSTLTSTVAEVKTISATISGTAITQTASVTVNPVSSISASLSSVVASPTSFPAGGSSTITVTVVDGSGNPLSGIAVTLSSTGSGNTITQPAATNASGVTTGTLGSTGAGSHTVTAVAGGVTLNQQPVVAVAAGLADAGQSTVTAQPTSITVGTGTSTITVTVKDAYGNPVSGSTVVLAATGSGNTLTGGGATNTSGVATGTLNSTVAETKIVSATADLVAITQTASVTVTSGSTITQTLLTSGHDPTNTQTYMTASIAPVPNTLVLVAVLTHQGTSAAPSPTLTGGGMTGWDVVASVVYDGSTPLDRLTIYRAMSSAPGSGSITIKSSVTVSNCQWIVSQWSGVDASGTNGSGAIVQTGSLSGTAVTGLTVPLGTFASGNDVAYGAFGVASATAVIAAGSGFTTIDQQPSGESTVGDLLAEWALNQPAIAATWPSKSAGALGVEIKAAP
jgi:invasin-like protein/Big-like domain-containing protein/calcineurin-like phosphoesterase family protein